MKALSVTNIVEITLTKLLDAGYSPATYRGFRDKYESLLAYCSEKQIEQYTEEVGRQYLEDIAQTRTFSNPLSFNAYTRGIARLNCILNDEQWQPLRRELIPLEESVFSDVLNEYIKNMKERRISDYRFKGIILARFLKQVELLGCTDLKALDAQIIYSIFTGGVINPEYFGRHVKPFCKYAYIYGLTSVDLSLVVPSRKRHENVPSVYTPEEVERVLAAVDLTPATGKRNYAIVLIAARLGLRAGDIAKMKLGNINFSDSTIKIAQSKTHRPLKLPMSDEIKSTLQDYIAAVKLDSQDGVLFQKQFNAGPLTGEAVSHIVHRAFLRAEVDCTNKASGSHALRASLATALLNEGNDYAAIRDILGHSDIQTSKAYVKTEIEKLRNSVLPVPAMSGSFAAQLNKYSSEAAL